jgi:hypothetical protein
LLPLRVLSVREEITQQQKTNGQRRINWNLRNIADIAEHTHRIKKRNNFSLLRVVFFRISAAETKRKQNEEKIFGI